MEHPELMTPEEREAHNYELGSLPLPHGWPPRALKEVMHLTMMIRPDAEHRRAFEGRAPAMGLTEAQIDDIAVRARDEALPGVELRRFFCMLREMMLRVLISCDGCRSVDDLLDVLRAEVTSGVPAPVPDWYKFSTVTMGPRKIGYDRCDKQGCFRTETTTVQFRKCAQCKLPWYCSKECQAMDWKARHRKVCKEASESRNMVAQLGKMMGMLGDASGGGAGDFAELLRGNINADTAQRMAARKAARKQEAKRDRAGKK